MFEKVNPMHPDKIADRIAGAIVDVAYMKEKNPRIAVEVLIGHGVCHIIAESSVDISEYRISEIVKRISRQNLIVDYKQVNQDVNLAINQSDEIRCGDNGIFKGMPMTDEEKRLSNLSRFIYDINKSDGKYILSNNKLIVCQSNCNTKVFKSLLALNTDADCIVNPLGDWTGGIDVDTGATNRKLGSDLGQSITGGGIHGKDLSKADVSVTIYAWIKSQTTGKPVELYCAIGDTEIDDKPYSEIVNIAKDFINKIGGFEKLAEWGLI